MDVVWTMCLFVMQLFRRVASSLPGMDQAEQRPRDSILHALLFLSLLFEVLAML